MRIRLLLLPALLAVCALMDHGALAAPTRDVPIEQVTAHARSDDIWMISTRRLRQPHPCAPTAPAPRYWQRIGCRWRESSAEAFFLGLDPQRITCFYVHGNRVDSELASQRGMIIYRRLGLADHPTRFVIWSWPSKRVHGMIRDARLKANRADGEAYYLARTLAKFPKDAKVSLLGYSYGSRVVTGSLHLLGGGQLRGNALDAESLPEYRPRVALVAGALSHCWLCPQGAHGLATYQIDRLYTTFNPRDPALKRFHVTSKASHPQALGYRGISARCLGPNADLVCQHNVSSIVGRSHGFDRHFESRIITRRVSTYVLWKEVP